MEPFALPGTYPSLIEADRGRDPLIASYGPEGYARLERVKARYDPDNVFRPYYAPRRASSAREAVA